MPMEKSKIVEGLKKTSKLDKFREAEQILIVHGTRPLDSKRPFTASTTDSIKEADGWRKEIITEIIEKVENISDPNLDEFRARELNDSINRSMREMRHWEYRIKEIGGPDYLKRGVSMVELGGVCVPGTKGYRYFGRAKYLPGVVELFEEAAQMQEKLKPEEMVARVDCDYYGYRDEDDGLLLEYEAKRETGLILELGGDNLGCVDVDQVPTQSQVEEWIVSQRRNDLTKRYLA